MFVNKKFKKNMKLFTEIVAESKREFLSLDHEELKRFIDIVKKSKAVSREYMTILQEAYALGIGGEELDKVINGSPRDMQFIQVNWGGPIESYQEINKLAKKIKPELKGLPWFMTIEDFNAVVNKKKDIGDVTLDLETDRGRDRCAKQYASLVVAIAKKYEHSGLPWDGLISAGYLGLTKAMNDYHKPDEYIDIEKDNIDKEETKKAKGMSFKQYASFRIMQQILNDINELSRTVRITQYEYEKNKKEGNTKGNFNIVSVDEPINDEGDTLVDRLVAFSDENDAFNDRSADRKWSKIYKAIDNKFSTRVATTFYKYFGINGYKKMSGVEIAKEMNVTGAAVSLNVKTVMNFLKSNKETRDILMDLLSLYTESLICSYPASMISEVMINDDVLIMLVESTQWCNKKVFNNVMGNALESFYDDSKEFIINCLENDLNYIDENYDAHRANIIGFLENVYPTKCIRRKSDVEIISMMNELSENFKEHNIE